jgi:hypothetical protein
MNMLKLAGAEYYVGKVMKYEPKTAGDVTDTARKHKTEIAGVYAGNVDIQYEHACV